MGVSRYSSNPTERRRQVQFDHLQDRCRVDYYSPTIGELTEAGIMSAHWECVGIECWHRSESFDLRKFGPKLHVRDLRRNYYCSRCGAWRPRLRLEWNG